jgi:hypothetical protein
MFDRVILILLAVFFLLFGLFSVTNITVEWGKTLMGLAALIVGIVCLVRAVR